MPHVMIIFCFLPYLGTWEWENEKGKWSTYEEQTQNLLHAAKKFSLKQVEFTVQGKKYVVNLTRMEQANKSTRVRRKVRCLESRNDEEGQPFHIMLQTW